MAREKIYVGCVETSFVMILRQSGVGDLAGCVVSWGIGRKLGPVGCVGCIVGYCGVGEKLDPVG